MTTKLVLGQLFHNAHINTPLRMDGVPIPGIHICLESIYPDSDTVGKWYSVFKTWSDVFALRDRLPKPQRCMYEIITNDSQIRPFFDIECENENFCTDDRFLEIVQTIVDVSITMLRDNYGITIDERDIVKCFSLPNNMKKSAHLVITSCYITGMERVKIFCHSIRTVVNSRLGLDDKIIDPSVYKSFQQFRLVGCTKYGANRYKICVSDASDYDTLVCPKTDIGTEIQVMLPVSGRLQLKNCAEVEKTYNVEQCEAIIDAINKHLGFDVEHRASPITLSNPNRIFKTDGIIELKRNKTTYCDKCKRRHDRENPFISIAGNLITYNCRRGQGICIGTVNKTADKLTLDEIEPQLSIAEPLRYKPPPVLKLSLKPLGNIKR